MSSAGAATPAPALSGRGALVTGGGRGIGRAIALGLARAGADVALAARTRGEVDSVAAQVQALGRRALAIEADVSREGAASYVVHEALTALGRLDVLVNNAGTFARGLVQDLAVEEWDRVIQTNLRGPFLITRAALRPMIDAGGGTIVFIGSTSGKRGDAGSSAYCASKFGLLGLAQALFAEVRRSGIRVITVSPSSVRTDGDPSSPLQGPGSKLDAEDVAAAVVQACALPPRALVREIELWNTWP